jgi:hypothetical protein
MRRTTLERGYTDIATNLKVYSSSAGGSMEWSDRMHLRRSSQEDGVGIGACGTYLMCSVCM